MFLHYLELAARSARASKGLSALMVLALALGIGACMTTLTVYHVLSGDPIPAKSDRLFNVQLDASDMVSWKAGDEPTFDLTRFDATALLREKKPYWTTVIGLGDRSEACDGDPFVDATYPPSTLHEIREKDCAQRPADAVATRERNLANNMPKYLASGARLVLGTDAGIDARHAFGWADHHELSRWVQSGVPISEAIVAATSRPAALMGATDLGSIAVGKSADFLVLTANPLEDIRNTRRIDKVFLRGVALDRSTMAAEFRRDGNGK